MSVEVIVGSCIVEVYDDVRLLGWSLLSMKLEDANGCRNARKRASY